MADPTPPVAEKGGELLKKKIGPLPVVVWILIGVGVWWYTSRNAASSSQTTDTSIDPVTGESYAAELAAAEQRLSDTEADKDTGTQGGQYANNEAWKRAAINYLVGIGINGTEATQAIDLYLASRPLSAQQQADVNLAIQAIGAPPSPPGPSKGGGGVPPPPPKPPTRGKKAQNPPKNLHTTAVHSNSISLAWSPVANATGYSVLMNDGDKDHDVRNTTEPHINYGGSETEIRPGRHYRFDVWGTPASKSPPHATISVSTPRRK